MSVQLQLSLLYFLFAKCESTRSKFITEKTLQLPVRFFLTFCLSLLVLRCVLVCSSLLLNSVLVVNSFNSVCCRDVRLQDVKIQEMLSSSVVCPQNQFQHHLVQQFWRKTVSSSTSCPTWAAPGSKPPAMRQRHRRPWPPCGLRVLSPSRSPCMSPVDQMALSGQPHSETGRVAYCNAVVVD